MKWFTKLFNFYINSSIHVALAVCALTLITLQEIDKPVSQKLILFIFFGTITGYNFVKYSGVARLHHRSLTDSLKVIQIFSFMCFAAWVYFILQLPFNFLLRCVPLGLLTLLYALPVFPKKKNLRRVPTLKIFVIAAVWAGATVYLPVVYHAILWDWDLFIVLFQRFLIVLALIIPFEIRDYKYDDAELGTIPQILGVVRTKLTGIVLLIGFVILAYFKDNLSYDYLYATLIITIILSVVILLTRKEQSRYFSSFWVEGIPILWWVLYAII